VAEQFGVGLSAVIKWVQRWCDTGSATAKPSGGSVSPLGKYAQWFFDLIAVQPDLTLDEVMVAKRRRASPAVAMLWGVSSVATISPLRKPVRR
jgi:transposase